MCVSAQVSRINFFLNYLRIKVVIRCLYEDEELVASPARYDKIKEFPNVKPKLKSILPESRGQERNKCDNAIDALELKNEVLSVENSRDLKSLLQKFSDIFFHEPMISTCKVANQ